MTRRIPTLLRRGMTLAEVGLASGMSLLVVIALLAVASALSASGAGSVAAGLPRADLARASDLLRADLAAAMPCDTRNGVGPVSSLDGRSLALWSDVTGDGSADLVLWRIVTPATTPAGSDVATSAQLQRAVTAETADCTTASVAAAQASADYRIVVDHIRASSSSFSATSINTTTGIPSAVAACDTASDPAGCQITQITAALTAVSPDRSATSASTTVTASLPTGAAR